MNGLIELMGSLVSRFVERDYEEEPVKVMVTAQGLTVFIEDGFMEFAKGSEYMVPRWIARELSANGSVTIVEEDVDKQKLSTLVFIEDRNKTQPKFEKLKGYFYHRLRDKAGELVNEYSRIRDMKRLQEISDLIKAINDSSITLSRLRTRKIMNLLMASGLPMDHVENLSEEEKLFLNSLKTLLEVLYKYIIGVGSGESGTK